MKALVIPRFGEPDVLTWTDQPEPVPGPGELLVRVRAFAVNWADLMQRAEIVHLHLLRGVVRLLVRQARCSEFTGPEGKTRLIGVPTGNALTKGLSFA